MSVSPKTLNKIMLGRKKMYTEQPTAISIVAFKRFCLIFELIVDTCIFGLMLFVALANLYLFAVAIV